MRPVLVGRPPYVPAVDSIVPPPHRQRFPQEWSSGRLVSASTTSCRATRVIARSCEAGAGLFTGRPPLFWLFGGFSAYGLATRTLQCGALPTDVGPAPAFSDGFSRSSARVRSEDRRSAPHARRDRTSWTRACARHKHCARRWPWDAQLPFGDRRHHRRTLYSHAARRFLFADQPARVRTHSNRMVA
jgi:hypothetical protein